MNKITKYLSIIFSIVAIGIIAVLILESKKPVPITVYPTPILTSLPTISESPMPIVAIPYPDPKITANWKIYKNSKYGIEIKYPRDFKIIESYLAGMYPPARGDGIVKIEKMLCCAGSFEDGMGSGIAFSSDKSDYLSADDLFKKEISVLNESKEISKFSPQKISFGNFAGIRTVSINPEATKQEDISLYWKTEKGVYYISWFSADPLNKGFNADNYFFPMLSTLKITE